MTPQFLIFHIAVVTFTILAMIFDLKFRKIPNKLTVTFFALGLIYQAVFNQWAGLKDAGLAFLIGFGFLFILWLIGGGGGGDVKLMGALSVWLGYRKTLYVLIASTAVVIVITCVVIVWSLITKGSFRTKQHYLATGKQTKGKKPVIETVEQRKHRRIMAYAVPVAIATWLICYLIPTVKPI